MADKENVNANRSLKAILLPAAIYAIWFCWLVYVAWVNISAGNQ